MTENRKPQEPRIVAECWTCKPLERLVCRIDPSAADPFYRKPHCPHKAECWTGERRLIGPRQLAIHLANGHDVRPVRPEYDCSCPCHASTRECGNCKVGRHNNRRRS